MKTGKKIGLALGGGGARALAHIGVLKFFSENRIPIHAIAGTSMGALIGAVYAAGLPVEQMVEIANNTDWKLTAKMMMPTLARTGFIEGTRIQEFIKTLVGDLNIDDLKIPFAAVATDVMTGEEIIIQQGSLTKAVRASISIPAIFTPFCYRNKFLVDGGLVNPVPTNVVRNMRVDIVIAVNVTHIIQPRVKKIKLKNEQKELPEESAINSNILNRDLSKYIQEKIDKLGFRIANNEKDENQQSKKLPGPNIIDTILQTIHIMENEILQLKLQQSPPDVLIEPIVDFVSLLEFHKAKELIWAGEVAAAENMTLIEKLLK